MGKASGPLTLITAMAPCPGAVAMAAMVELSVMQLQKYKQSANFQESNIFLQIHLWH